MRLPGRWRRAGRHERFTVRRAMPGLQNMRSAWTLELWSLKGCPDLQRKRRLT